MAVLSESLAVSASVLVERNPVEGRKEDAPGMPDSFVKRPVGPARLEVGAAPEEKSSPPDEAAAAGTPVTLVLPYMRLVRIRCAAEEGV